MNRDQRQTPTPPERDLKATGGLSSPAGGIFVKATASYNAGRLPEAETLYRAVLALQPGHPDAHHLLGVIAHQSRRSDVAVTMIEKAIALRSDVAAYHSNLGNALKALGRLDEAIVAYSRAIALDPSFAHAHGNLGAALNDCGQWAEAVASHRRALALDPNFAEAHSNLGVVLKNQGKLGEAEASYREALRINPKFARALYNLANLLREQTKVEEAVAVYRQALGLQPNLAEAHNNLGNALKDLGRLDEAAESYGRAVALRSDFVDAHNNLGAALIEQSKLDAAGASFRRALALRPNFAVAINNLGNVFRDQGRMDEAVALYERCLTLAPDFRLAHSNLLMSQHYLDRVSCADLLAAAKRFGESLGAAPTVDFVNDKNENRRLRVGYVSGDFRQHPVGYFLERVLKAHDPAAVEVFCYANQAKTDATTLNLRAAAAHWRAIIGLSDADAVAMIRKDAIDILIDLSGHTAKNRLSIFALRAAPIQASWLGYFGSTGVAAMDYLVMDKWAAPPDEEPWQTEALARLPHTRFCYAPPDYAPEVLDPPSSRGNGFAFGSFNNVAKIGPEVIKLWAAVLKATPGSRLILKWKSFDEEDARKRIMEAFAAAGVGENRLEIRGFSPHAEMLAQYGDIDVALDPFPFGGGLTSCEALWMGVPVLTLPGDRPASRQTIGFLDAIGLNDCVATSAEDYVSRAAAFTTDPRRLVELRREMRPRMKASPLCDGALFTRHLETAYRHMWRRWAKGEAPGSFDVEA